MDPLDPAFRAFLASAEMRAALDARDIATMYRLLGRAGISQRQIAELTHQSQSEVSAILQGRQVHNVLLLERIADGLRVPRGWMRLDYGEGRPDAPPVPVQEVNEKVERRALFATTSLAVLGRVVQGMGELTELALPARQPLPSRLSMPHVHTVRAVTERLRSVARYYGGQADLFATTVELYTPWMTVPATDTIKAQLAAALAELHTEAGWCCFDSDIKGMGYFTRALRLAGNAGDTYGIANAALHAGITLVRSGQPSEALKQFQLGQFRLDGPPPGTPTPPADDPRIPALTSRLNLNTASAYALVNDSSQADHYLTMAHEGWAARDAFERAGGDRVTAVIHLDLHRLDAAQQSAASAVHTYGENHRRGHTLAKLLLAEVHIRAGEPQGLTLAHDAIEAARTLQSPAARRERLLPLATALETRPSNDTQQLAQRARKLAATPT